MENPSEEEAIETERAKPSREADLLPSEKEKLDKRFFGA